MSRTVEELFINAQEQRKVGKKTSNADKHNTYAMSILGLNFIDPFFPSIYPNNPTIFKDHLNNKQLLS